jgi:ATP-dependent DNA ligase
VDIKYDGEHVLLHRMGREGDYKMFSRNGLDHTEKYGTRFFERVNSCLKDSVENFVLDGELLVKDTLKGTFRASF